MTTHDVESPDMKPFFDRDMTNAIKGIALIMMFAHHFFTFPNWWVEGISYPTIAKYADYFMLPLKLCVPVFCFLSVYFYFFNRQKTFKYSCKKITDILLSYWVVFLPFALLAVIFADYHYSLKDFVLELFALSFPTMIFCWYVSFYCVSMLLLPYMIKFFFHEIHCNLALALIVIPFVFSCIPPVSNDITIVNDMYRWFANIAVGYLFAKHDLFCKICAFNDRIIKCKLVNICLWFLGVMAFPMGRLINLALTISSSDLPIVHKSMAFAINLDVLYAPLFIYCLVRFFQSLSLKRVRVVIDLIGRYSLQMWFVHCIFYGNSKAVFQPLLYFPKIPVLVLLWGLLICIAVSVPLNLLSEKINKLKNRYVFH